MIGLKRNLDVVTHCSPAYSREAGFLVHRSFPCFSKLSIFHDDELHDVLPAKETSGKPRPPGDPRSLYPYAGLLLLIGHDLK